MKFHSMITAIALSVSTLGTATTAQAQTGLPDAFTFGPLLDEFGPAATIADATPIPDGAQFAIAFDTATGAEPAKHNRVLMSAARFLNMHARAGVAAEDMRLAVVVHGSAAFDLVDNAAYGAHHAPGRDDKPPNANAALIAALQEQGVRIILCGQSAAAQGIDKADLLPGVELALSAMTAHALLQQEGYTLNPF